MAGKPTHLTNRNPATQPNPIPSRGLPPRDLPLRRGAAGGKSRGAEGKTRRGPGGNPRPRGPAGGKQTSSSDGERPEANPPTARSQGRKVKRARQSVREVKRTATRDVERTEANSPCARTMP